jgi:hypothetical protein
MEKTISVINVMQQEGLFERYAIAGGIAALFYIEPVTTFVLDVFIILRTTEDQIISLSPIYTWLTKRGYIPEREQVIIEGSLVQFLPVYNDLTEQAVYNSVEHRVGNTRTSVVSREYLFAIMMQTGRSKDLQRMQLFWDEAGMDINELERIVNHFNLHEQYRKFNERKT